MYMRAFTRMFLLDNVLSKKHCQNNTNAVESFFQVSQDNF